MLREDGRDVYDQTDGWTDGQTEWWDEWMTMVYKAMLWSLSPTAGKVPGHLIGDGKTWPLSLWGIKKWESLIGLD